MDNGQCLPPIIEEECRAEQFIERFLTFTKGPKAGQPFLLEDWQKQILRRIYNDLDEDGFRRIRTFYTSIAKKNGKTELAAAIGAVLDLLCEDLDRDWFDSLPMETSIKFSMNVSGMES